MTLAARSKINWPDLPKTGVPKIRRRKELNVVMYYYVCANLALVLNYHGPSDKFPHLGCSTIYIM